MKHYFSELKFKSCSDFMSNLDADFKELHQYADHKFNNGISMRVVTGDMAKTNIAFPFEANVTFPGGKTLRNTMLDRKKLIRLMHKLDKLEIDDS